MKEIVPTPIAVDDTRQTIVNTPVTLNVVANDSHDVDGTAFSIVSVTQPENGSVTFDAGAGTVTYTPRRTGEAQAEFSYTVADDANVTRSDRGDVLITVAAALPWMLTSTTAVPWTSITRRTSGVLTVVGSSRRILAV